MEIISGKKKSSWKIVIYGPPGVGKSSLSAFAPKPLFLDLELGLDQIARQLEERQVILSRTPRINDWKTDDHKKPGFLEAMKFAVESDYETIVIDTISGLDQILVARSLQEFNSTAGNKAVGSLGQVGWNQGYDILAAQWSYVMKLLTRAQEEYRKNIILVGHSAMAKVEDPTTDSYDKFVIDVHKKCLPAIVNNVDAVFFARQEVIVKEKENSQRLRGVSTGERFLYCLDQPSFLAKNRFGLPEKIKMTPEVFPELCK